MLLRAQQHQHWLRRVCMPGGDTLARTSKERPTAGRTAQSAGLRPQIFSSACHQWFSTGAQASKGLESSANTIPQVGARAHRRVSALDSSSTRTCFTRRSSSRFTGVMSLGSVRSTALTRRVTASSSASRRPACSGTQLSDEAETVTRGRSCAATHCTAFHGASKHRQAQARRMG